MNFDANHRIAERRTGAKINCGRITCVTNDRSAAYPNAGSAYRWHLDSSVGKPILAPRPAPFVTMPRPIGCGRKFECLLDLCHLD